MKIPKRLSHCRKSFSLKFFKYNLYAFFFVFISPTMIFFPLFFPFFSFFVLSFPPILFVQPKSEKKTRKSV